MTDEKIIHDLMDAMTARLVADDYFSDILIVREDTGDFTTEINKVNGMLQGYNGKLGALVLVAIPGAGVKLKDIHCPPLELRPWLLVLENPLLNRKAYNGNRGTDKPAVSIARRLVRVFHNWQVRGLTTNMVAQDDAIQAHETDLAPVGIAVHFQCTESRASNQKVALPLITFSSGDCTLTCSTAGATIRYTTDGSYPGKTATAYAAPFAVTAGDVVTAVAYKTGLVASDGESKIAV